MLQIALAIIPIVLMLAVGLGLKRFHLLRAEDAGTVNKLILYGTLPAFTFVAVYQQKLPHGMARVPALALVVTVVVMALAWLAAKAMRLDRPTTGGLVLAAAFGNTGFLGYPIVSAALPAAMSKAGLSTAVIFDNFGMALPLYSIGVSAAAHFGGEKPQWRHLLEFTRLPSFGATIIALVLRLWAPQIVPEVLMKSLGYLMQATVPLAMISLGLSLSWRAVKGSRATVLAACFLKLLVFPALMIGLLRLFPLPTALRAGTMFESCMPTAMMTAVIAARYHTNGRFVSAAIVVSTILSIITMPIIVSLAGY